MAFGTLELRNIPKVQRMFERLIALVTGSTLPRVLVAQVDWVLKAAV